MKLFETSWMNDFKVYERVFDPDTGITQVNKIDGKSEYFVEDPKGLYSDFLDSTIKYSKKFGNAKDAREHAGACSPIYRNIRDNYIETKSFNKNPRVWYLDIETRSGVHYKITDSRKVLLKNKSTGEITRTTLEDTQKLKDSDLQNYLISEDGSNFSEVQYSTLFEKTQSFPDPGLAEQEITLIQVLDNIEQTVYILGLRDFELSDLEKLGYSFDYSVKYANCKSEIQLLNTFLVLFNKLNPLLILAWNGNGFDYPYIVNRLKNLGFSESLSKYGSTTLTKSINDKGRVSYKLDSNGHFFMDFMEIYKKFTFDPRSSYSLDNISEIELGEHKVPHTEFLTFDSFYTGTDYQYTEKEYSDKLRELIRKSYGSDEFFKNVNLQFVYYGITDVILLKKLNDKLQLVELMSTVSEIMGVLLDDTLKTVKPWSQHIANEAMKQKKVMPPKREVESPKIVGGFVKEPIPGLCKWCMNVDVNSMYPMLSIAAFNMSPETYISMDKAPADLRDLLKSVIKKDQDEEQFLDLKDNNPEKFKKITELLQKYKLSLGINGALFDISKKGLIPSLVTEIYNNRKQAKKTMNNYIAKSVMIKDILHKRGK
jgi:DNA polymerase elongation subunit (family B)